VVTTRRDVFDLWQPRHQLRRLCDLAIGAVLGLGVRVDVAVGVLVRAPRVHLPLRRQRAHVRVARRHLRDALALERTADHSGQGLVPLPSEDLVVVTAPGKEASVEGERAAVQPAAHQRAHPHRVQRLESDRHRDRVAHVIVLLAQSQLATVAVTDDEAEAGLLAGEAQLARPPPLRLRLPLAAAAAQAALLSSARHTHRRVRRGGRRTEDEAAAAATTGGGGGRAAAAAAASTEGEAAATATTAAAATSTSKRKAGGGGGCAAAAAAKRKATTAAAAATKGGHPGARAAATAAKGRGEAAAGRRRRLTGRRTADDVARRVELVLFGILLDHDDLAGALVKHLLVLVLEEVAPSGLARAATEEDMVARKRTRRRAHGRQNGRHPSQQRVAVAQGIIYVCMYGGRKDGAGSANFGRSGGLPVPRERRKQSGASGAAIVTMMSGRWLTRAARRVTMCG
jgi:hypothetical protein